MPKSAVKIKTGSLDHSLMSDSIISCVLFATILIAFLVLTVMCIACGVFDSVCFFVLLLTLCSTTGLMLLNCVRKHSQT
jgi:hypothetical protein